MTARKRVVQRQYLKKKKKKKGPVPPLGRQIRTKNRKQAYPDWGKGHDCPVGGKVVNPEKLSAGS